MRKPTNKTPMHQNANSNTFKKAQWLRENETPAEKRLWDQLKGKRLEGYKFRRQHPVGKYILDFYCHAKKLVIEIDGEYHQERLQEWQDKERTANLKALGLSVVRFTNEEVFVDMDKVVGAIKEALRRE